MGLLDLTRGDMPPDERAARLLRLAAGYDAIGELRPALSALNESMMELQGIGGQHMLIYERLGRILERLDHPAGAVLAYRDAIRLAKPDNPLVAALRARLRELGETP